MKIEDNRLAFAPIDSFDPQSEEVDWQQTKVASASDRKIHSKQASSPDRALDQRRLPITPDRVGKPRRSSVAVAIVENRIDAGVVAEPFLGQDVVRPGLVVADREVGSAVTEHAFTGDVFEEHLGLMNVGAEFEGSLSRDELMMIAMARDFVPFTGDLPDHRGVIASDLS